MWMDDSREIAAPGIILKMEIGKILPKLLKLPEQRAELATQLIRSLMNPRMVTPHKPGVESKEACE